MFKTVDARGYRIYLGEGCWDRLEEYIISQEEKISKVFILVDENTRECCLPYFLMRVPSVTKPEIIQVQSGEAHKNVDTCSKVWSSLSYIGADRSALFINLGGGVITDMGGFVASTFKRGIKFVNIPTTLLSMVDASVGGKTGIDFEGLKNQIGTFSLPEMVLIDSHFLGTLESRQMRSGLAEMLKHGLICDVDTWNQLQNLKGFTIKDLDVPIWKSVQIKDKVVQGDPTERHRRKILNFGHTLGHAIETFYLQSPKNETLLHGEAIAMGMIMEAYLSHLCAGLPIEDADNIRSALVNTYGIFQIQNEDIQSILDNLRHDKKNKNGLIRFSLLKKIGRAIWDVQVDDEEILKSFRYYTNFI